MAQNRTDVPPHPDYGLDNETRLKALRDAENLGVKVAADKNGVSASIIYIWRKRLNLEGGRK